MQPQQPQQAQQALQAQQGLPPQQEQRLAAENRELQGDVLRLLAALGRTDLKQQAQHAQQAAEQLRLQAEVRRLQAHIQQLEPEAEMMRSIRQQAHQAQQAQRAQQVRGSSEVQQNGAKQAQQVQQHGAKQAQRGAGRRHKTREDYLRRRQPGVNGRRSGASSAQLISQLPQQWAVVAVGALGMALCALTGGVALSRLGKMRERQQAH